MSSSVVAEAFPEDNDKEKSINVKAKYLYIASLEPAKSIRILHSNEIACNLSSNPLLFLERITYYLCEEKSFFKKRY